VLNFDWRLSVLAFKVSVLSVWKDLDSVGNIIGPRGSV
jgi:hypothetical protein